MIRYAAVRFAVFVVTVLVAAAIVYLFAGRGDAAPGFFQWLGGALVGDYGQSLRHEAIGGLLGGALSVSVPLILLAAVLAGAIGAGIGVLAARQPGSWVDRALQALVEIGVAVPNFWLGALLALLFSATLRWLPPGGFVPWTQNPVAAFASLILPALALALPQAAVLARSVRSALLAARTSAYLRTAQGRGLTAREALRAHGWPNAALAVMRTLGRQFAALIAGAMIVENVFYLSGLGRLVLDGIAGGDFAVVRSGVLVLVLLIAGTLFLSQLALAWVDPRLRRERTA
jgi:peptide/nickel transport system permease protein